MQLCRCKFVQNMTHVLYLYAVSYTGDGITQITWIISVPEIYHGDHKPSISVNLEDDTQLALNYLSFFLPGKVIILPPFFKRSFSWIQNAGKWKLLGCVRLFVTPWTIQSMEFSRPETRVGSHSLPQGMFSTQGSNPGLPHCRRILYQLSYRGNPNLPFE